MKQNDKIILPLTFVLGLSVGGVGTHLYQQNKNESFTAVVDTQKKYDRFYDRFFNQDFFAGKSSPFEQMEKIRDEMDKLTFDDWYKGRFGGDISEIKQSEDSKNVYYRINLEGLDRQSVRVDVVNGQLNIFGQKNEIEAQEDDENNQVSRYQFHQSFQRSFPVPEGVDDTKVKVSTEGDEIVVQFPKKKDKNLI